MAPVARLDEIVEMNAGLTLEDNVDRQCRKWPASVVTRNLKKLLLCYFSAVADWLIIRRLRLLRRDRAR